MKALQHAFRGVAVDAGIDDPDVGALGSQYRLELRRIGLIARDPLAIGVAGAKRDDGGGAGGRGCENEDGSQDRQQTRDAKSTAARFHACPQ